MNENLNLVEILKDCPKGTKLYSTVNGEVKFEKIGVCVKYPIVIKLKDGRCTFTSEGKLFVDYDGECVLFPSKDQRDWSKFNPKKEELAPPCKFKVGDWIVFNGLTLYIKEVVKGFYRTISKGGISNSYDWDIDNIARLWVIQDARDGDVLAAHECYVIFKEIDGLNIKCYCTYHYLGLNPSFYRDTLQNKDAFLPATKEQRDAMMKAMNDAGYEWDEKKKELKLVQPKFDPKTLKPFDKVLVKKGTESYYAWYPDFICLPPTDVDDTIYCIGTNDVAMAIPYNDDTKHLINTNEEAPDLYKYWEED